MLLHFDFSVMMWVRFDDLAADYTLFSKDRNQDTDGLVFRAYVDTSGLLKVTMADSDDWAAPATVSSADPRKVTAVTWTHVGFSVDMDNNAQDS